MGGLRRKANTALGFSMVELLISLGILSVVATGVGTLAYFYYRNQQAVKLRDTYLSLQRRISSTLKNPAALRKSAANHASAYSGNRNLLNCLYNEGSADNNNASDCTQPPMPAHPSIVPLSDPAQPNQLNNTLFTRRQLVLVDAVNQPVHPPGKMYWTIDGVACDGQNGHPLPSSPPAHCPIETSIFYHAICNRASNLITETRYCEIATHFKFYYSIKIRDNVNIPGRAFVRNYSTHADWSTDPIVYTTSDIVRFKIANPGQCDTENGYVMSGVDTMGNIQCSKVETQKTLLAYHSMRDTIPGCTFNVIPSGQVQHRSKSFPARLANGGYSFAGAWIAQRVGSVPDLASTGSCLALPHLNDVLSRTYTPRRYYTDLFAEFDHTDRNPAWTTGRDFSMWLRATNRNASVALADFANTAPFVSRCNICEIDGPVVAVHNFNAATPDAPPACPSGWDRLYTGRSLAAMTLQANDDEVGYTHGTELSSAGSCLPISGSIDPIPFIECKHFTSDGTIFGPGAPPQCQYRSPNDYALWYARDNNRAYQCSVCYKPPRIEPQPFILQATVIGN